jgi:type IX secretion system PorP/SprF family membrane protein
MKFYQEFYQEMGLKQVKIFTLLLFFCFHYSTLKAQQGAMYSQYMFNMLSINPAYAGNRAVDNVTVLYRNQWAGIPGAPQSAFISWDKRQQDSNVGYGAQIYTDHIGDENVTGTQGFYSFRIPFRRSTLTLGLSGGVFNYGFQLLGSNALDQGDQTLMDENIWVPTVGMGALYFTEKWYVGLSIPTLLKTEVNLSDKVQKVNNFGANHQVFLSGGYIYDVNYKLSLKPSFLLKSYAGAPIQIDMNLNAWYINKYGAGFSYRTGDFNTSGAVVAIAEYQITPQIRVGYAYDYTLSVLSALSNRQTHEFLLRYEFDTSKSSFNIRSPRYY